MSFKTLLFGIILVAGGMVGITAHAASSFCTPDKNPTIRVGLVAPTPRSDLSKNMAQLEKFHIDTVNPYGAKIDTHVGGLTSGIIKVEQRMAISGASQLGQTCLWPKHVQVTIRLDQVVYVAKEYKPGTCMNSSVWDHEHKHVRVDREIINKYRPIFENTVRVTVARMGAVGPFKSGDQKAYQDRMMKQISEAIGGVSQKMEAERNNRQQAVDTIEEYERVSNLCKKKSVTR